MSDNKTAASLIFAEMQKSYVMPLDAAYTVIQRLQALVEEKDKTIESQRLELSESMNSIESLSGEIAECACLLPGVKYMDQPDGGSPSIGKQLKRMLDEKDSDLEKLRMQLSACGVIAMANTRESATKARQMHPDYMCASVQDVVDAVDREITLREIIANIEKSDTELTDKISGLRMVLHSDGATEDANLLDKAILKIKFSCFTIDKLHETNQKCISNIYKLESELKRFEGCVPVKQDVYDFIIAMTDKSSVDWDAVRLSDDMSSRFKQFLSASDKATKENEG